MKDLARTVRPLENEEFEKIVQTTADELLSKPGFIKNATTREYIIRALRKVVLDTKAIELSKAAQKLFLGPDPNEDEKA